MLWAITALTFLATFGVLAALFYAFSSQGGAVAERLSRLANTAAPRVEEDSFVEKQKENVRNTLAGLSKLVPGGDASSGTPRTQLLLIRAGYRSSNALAAMRGFKILTPIVFVGLTFATGAYKWNPIMFPLVALALGYLFPDMFLTWRVNARQGKIRRGLPDGLDLLVICVESGLGLDQALMKVSQELRITHHELSEELQLVNLEMRIGKTRIEALRELARRTGLEDIKSLVAMLVQTDRFGTSVAQSLRVFSDDLRTKRRQRAEEMSAKTTVKMVPPLIFFIFPALMVVILGPAVITLFRQLMPALGH
ncbi:MAG TPA: type II secretion system F family protein [Candidatus Acidoferrum sp.]|jgi:tight adherence protein C|nr:type II secretion system F family protein [Candidatus Acidoferrum sp.]